MTIPNFAKKVGDVVWEIPKSFKPGMKVPARVYASEKLMEGMDDGVFNQVTNVATLPGIQKFAYAMPDAHWGYGFPVGGVAAFDMEEGVISPGGIGFDINCLAGDTEILTNLGFTRKIENFRHDAHDLLSYNDKTKVVEISETVAFMKRKAENILRVKTKSGFELRLTEDHPVFTPEGMILSKHLQTNMRIAVYPFSGVPYEQPSNETLIAADDIKKLNLPFSTERVIKELEKKGLMPLLFDNKALPYLAKIAGLNMGDGTVVCTNKAQFVAFYGKKEDLELVQQDLEKIGFKSYLHQRERNHSIDTKYGNVSFVYTENSLHVTSNAFVALLKALEVPSGAKATQKYGVPSWIAKSPLWIKRLFLASFFGAEMSSPKTITHHDYNFYMPTVSMDKSESCIANGREFFREIISMLNQFGITATVSGEREEYINSKGEKRIRIRLLVNQDSENLISLYSRIGFEYNKKKTFLSNGAVLYLKLKTLVLKERENAAEISKRLYSEGMMVKDIVSVIGSESVNKRFIERSIFEGRKTTTRVALSFATFKKFLEERSENLGMSGFFWDEIESKESIKFNDFVYDFTVSRDSHNFVANSFLVSNCGMRLIRTDLTIKEVQPKLKEIVDLLFKYVPAGVGATAYDDEKGFLRLNEEQFKDMVTRGVEWCVENGYGWKEDLERIEEHGKIKGADVSKVSQRAIKRGVAQVGTLGSGNHYLEIQVVEEKNIYDMETAKALGVGDPGQIVVMVHCGSRGFGHQVATDYLQTFLRVMPKYGLQVIDRELAAAPFNSPEAKDYYGAMACAANMAFANRQLIVHRIRQAFEKIFGRDAESLGMNIVYDVCHNIAKIEEHEVDGEKKKVVMHRKGATRSFGPGHPELAKQFQKIGQPVIVGGSMETGSFLCVGTQQAMKETFGSTMHGSGRTMSRTKAKRMVRGEDLQRDMEKRGIYVKSVSYAGLAEEAGIAYKNISEVVDTMDRAGISKKVVQLRPIGNVKG